MAFRGLRRATETAISVGDRALIVTTRSAYGNPAVDETRVRGLARVTGGPRTVGDLSIGGREFGKVCEIEILTLLPRGQGLLLKNFAHKLEFIRKPEHWGQYIRNPPVLLPTDDFALLASSLEKVVWASGT